MKKIASFLLILGVVYLIASVLSAKPILAQAGSPTPTPLPHRECLQMIVDFQQPLGDPMPAGDVYYSISCPAGTCQNGHQSDTIRVGEQKVLSGCDCQALPHNPDGACLSAVPHNLPAICHN
jgi:hypothetical protein